MSRLDMVILLALLIFVAWRNLVPAAAFVTLGPPRGWRRNIVAWAGVYRLVEATIHVVVGVGAIANEARGPKIVVATGLSATLVVVAAAAQPFIGGLRRIAAIALPWIVLVPLGCALIVLQVWTFVSDEWAIVAAACGGIAMSIWTQSELKRRGSRQELVLLARHNGVQPLPVAPTAD